MIVAKVVLGKPYHPQSAGKVEETWKAPPAGHDSGKDNSHHFIYIAGPIC